MPDPGDVQDQKPPLEASGTVTRAGFHKDARLKKRPEYRLIYDTGRRIGGRFFLCFFKFYPAGADHRPRLGITASRKVGNAVVRNRIKRQTREFFRLNQSRMKHGFDVVVNARSQAVGKSSQEIWSDLDDIFKRSGVLTAPPPTDGNQ